MLPIQFRLYIGQFANNQLVEIATDTPTQEFGHPNGCHHLQYQWSPWNHWVLCTYVRLEQSGLCILWISTNFFQDYFCLEDTSWNGRAGTPKIVYRPLSTAARNIVIKHASGNIHIVGLLCINLQRRVSGVERYMQKFIEDFKLNDT